MGIVERAVQEAEAQAEAAARAGAPPPALMQATPPEPAPQVDPGFDDTSLTARDLKAIVHLDMERLRQVGRLPSAELATQTDDEIRRIKWPVLNAIAGRNGAPVARNNVVLVTSALPGEGKTFTSLNLALSIVRDREMRVVLVDGDVARPGLTPTLGLEGQPGLVDALEDITRDVGSVTYQTDVDGLFFVPAGKWHPHAPEFLAGSRMPEIIEALSRRVGRGVIILDSPPLLSTNEAQVATRYAGQVLLVVRADVTPQRAVLDAVALVDKAARVSAVLNACRAPVLSRYYGQYHYGYGYGYGERQGRQDRSGTDDA
jgi:Mrp family chromosome partitioning ATPase